MESPKKTFNPNKHLKEQFVSNLTGSTMFELFVLLCTLSILLLIRRTIGFHYRADSSLKKNDDALSKQRNWRAYFAAVVFDYLVIVVPIVAVPTVLHEWTCVIGFGLLLLLLLTCSIKRFGSSLFQEDGSHSLRENISSYRVALTVLTCLCILAVDFKIFPRKYAKTETYGTSLMDLGVGAYVLGNALVSRQARGVSMMTLRNALLSTAPLLFLGFARLIFTAGVDYQVHVGEYGVHWNFFFTLAAVSILTSIIHLPPKYCGILGSIILIGYQICLLNGLNEYMLSNERGPDIISQNKEGIFSIFGHWGLYLVGVQLGSYLFFGSCSNGVLRSNKWAKIRTWVLFVLFWLLAVFLNYYVERVSRRTCNLAYVASVLAMDLQVLAILMLSDSIPGNRLSLLEEAMNRNLLGTFLLANLLTGLVNLSIDTLSVSSASALALLLGYEFILCFAAALADFFNIRLKFW